MDLLNIIPKVTCRLFTSKKAYNSMPLGMLCNLDAQPMQGHSTCFHEPNLTWLWKQDTFDIRSVKDISQS